MDPNIRVATDEFIRRASKIHGDRYDYSFSIVEDSCSTVVIIDRETNTVFFQVVAEHLDGVEPVTTAVEPVDRSGRFITRAREIHGDRYDYSLVEYVNARSCVQIICSEHGIFEQTPDNHISKKTGCPRCGAERRAEQQRLSTEEFILRVSEVHGDKYDYSQVEYVNNHTKIQIICPEHGVFEQTPSKHLYGRGCPECAIEQQRSSTDEFVRRAREIHGYKYEYSLVEYVHVKTPVKIICPTHGVFEQRPEVHLHQRSGCQQCAETGFNPSEPGTLYVLADDKQYPTLIKIGITNDLKKRLRCLRYSTPHPIFKLVSYPFPRGADAYKLEQEVHKVFHELNARLKGFDGATEWFKYSSEMLDYISNRYRGQSP